MRCISSSGVRCNSSALAPRLSLVRSLRYLAQRYTRGCTFFTQALHGKAWTGAVALRAYMRRTGAVCLQTLRNDPQEDAQHHALDRVASIDPVATWAGLLVRHCRR